MEITTDNNSNYEFKDVEQKRGKQYFDILFRSTNGLNWLFLTLIIFTGVNMFLLYSWHFGNIKYAIKRETYNKTHIADLRIKANSSNPNIPYYKSDSEVEKEVSAKLIYLNDVSKQGLYNTLPFMGINFFKTDYAIVLLVIGSIFFFWLHRMLRFTRDVLKEYLNTPEKLNQTDNELIVSLFFMIIPSPEKQKRYKLLEFGLLFYISSIVLILISNIYELFVVHSYNLSLWNMPGCWSMMWPHLVVTNTVVLACLIFTSRNLWTIREHVTDLRNLVFLTKWDRTAFFPALYDLFKQSNRELINNANLIQYRRRFDKDKLYLCITLAERIDSKDKIHQIDARVDFAHSLQQYKNTFKGVIGKPVLDSFLNRYLTFEEQFMRDFLEKVLIDESYEPDLHNSWKTTTNIT